MRGLSLDWNIPSTVENQFLLFLILSILFYAEDTALSSESANGLQLLNDFLSFCIQWKLNVNVDKTKLIVFSKDPYVTFFTSMTKSLELWKT